MSYVRRGQEGSDVYVYGRELAADDEPEVVLYGAGGGPRSALPSFPDEWVCHECSLRSGFDPVSGELEEFSCRSPAAMIEHLREHQKIGETVPGRAFERLEREEQLLSFQLGTLAVTAGIEASGVPWEVLSGFVRRHARGDFGELEQHDWRANRRAIIEGTRVLSAYSHAGVRVFVVTEADRSKTTLLLRTEY